MKDNGVDIYSTVFAVTDEMIKRNPKLVQRVVSSLLVSLNKMNNDPELAITSLLADKKKNLPLEHTRLALKRSLELMQPLDNRKEVKDGCPLGRMGSMKKIRWERTEETLLEAKLIGKKLFSPGYYADCTFLNAHYAQ